MVGDNNDQSFVSRFCSGAREVTTKPSIYFFNKLLSIPGAISGNGRVEFNGSAEIFQTKFDEMSLVLKKLQNFNTASGMNEEDVKLFANRIDQIEVTRVARLKMVEEILKMDEEERKKEEDKLTRDRASFREEVDILGKKNADAIIGRILTSLVGLDVLDVLDIAFSVLENFVDTNFASGVKGMIADEKVLGPFAKSFNALGVDDIAGVLAKFPIIGDVNEGFTQFANSDYVSPFSSILGQTMQSEAANLLFRGLVVMRAVSHEVELNSQFNETQNRIDSAVPKMDEHLKVSINNHIEKMAPKIIELETKDELRHISFKAFLEDNTTLDQIFNDSFLNTKMRNPDGTDSAVQIRQYLENLRNENATDTQRSAMKDFANDPQNREIIEIILNVADQKYGSDPKYNSHKEDLLKKITQGTNPDLLKNKFLMGDDFKESFKPQVYAGIKKGLNEGKNLSEAIMGLDNNQIDDAIIGVAKIVKHDEKVQQIKTATPQRISAEESRATWVEIVASDSAGARGTERAH